MKDSIFNSRIQLSANIIAIYNAFNDKTIFVSKNMIKSDTLTSCTPLLLEKLYKNGFVIDDDYNEIEVYKKYVYDVENDKSIAHLIINPTINCNFKCWYCYEKHTKSVMAVDVIERLNKLVSKIFSEKRKLQISFFGGEPLIYYQQVMLPILENTQKAAEKMHGTYYVNMTTNGYLLNSERIKELKKYNYNGAQITLDGYKDLHDKVRFIAEGKGTYDIIISNIHELAKNEIPVTIRINCTNDNIESIDKIPESFECFTEQEKQQLEFNFQIVWQEGNKDEISTKMNSIVKSFMQKGLYAEKMSFREFCYADKRNACVINYNGDLYKCTAIDFANIKRDGYLSKSGELVWENESLEKRLSSKLKNVSCLSCRILPLCHGGCTKHSLNAQGEYCLYDFNDNLKNQVVLDVIEHNIQISKTK